MFNLRGAVALLFFLLNPMTMLHVFREQNTRSCTFSINPLVDQLED
jgi:hypothetical protein